MKIIKLVLSLITLLVMFNSCKKKFETPDKKDEPLVTGYITIDSIYKKYKDYYKTPPTKTELFRFSDDVNLLCTVTADETSGNVYKGAFVEDATGGLKINLRNFGGLYVGDKIRINLKGVVLNDYGRVVQLDSVDLDSKIVKLSSGNPVTPTKVTFNEMIFLNALGHSPFQSRLVIVDSVEFVAGEKGLLFADPIGRYSLDRNLVNANGDQVIVRSSGYANFANTPIPCGKGSMVVIVGQFNSDIQLTIRDYKEVKLATGGCPILIKSFNDNSALSGGWINYNVNGSVNWTTGTFAGQTYGKISNFINFVNVPCETWLISPSMDLTNAPNPKVSFQTAYNYAGDPLEVYVSTNYTSGNPSSAAWVQLNPALSSGSWSWVNSGTIPLSAYKSSNTRIAFKYKGTSSNGSTWEIDDIGVFGE